MDSPVSVTVANFVMEDVEERILKKAKKYPPLEMICGWHLCNYKTLYY